MSYFKLQLLGKVRAVMESDDTPEDISLDKLFEKAHVSANEYMAAIKTTRSGKQIILQRSPAEQFINQYNPNLLRIWKANMDLQYITDAYACIMYVTTYMMKTENSMSDMLKKVADECETDDVRSRLKEIGGAFLKSREVSAQEATYRILSMPLKRCSRRVIFVNTSPVEKRVSMLKPKHILDEMDDNDASIFATSPSERYSARPDELENMCYAEFAATYENRKDTQSCNHNDHQPEVLAPESSTSNKITLKDGLGSMRKRKRHAIIRFYTEKKEIDDKYRHLLMLYYPWRIEDHDLMGEFASYKDHYEHNHETVRRNEAIFSKNVEAIEQAFDDLERLGPPEHAWDGIAPNVEDDIAQQRLEGAIDERHMDEADIRENVDVTDRPQGNQSELHARFSKECSKTLMSSDTYRSMMRSLNKEQRTVLNIHRRWCKDSIIALKNNQPMPTYRIFLSGPGGTGKSHVIHLIHYETIKLLKSLSGHFEPDELPIILTAFTGTAAFNIDGMTLHSAFGFSPGPGASNVYHPLSSERLNTLRSRIGKLKLLIIDEVSMVGANLLYFIHRRLQDIIGENTDESRFGNISILAVGDLYQLQPVCQPHVFSVPNTGDYARLHGSLWKEKFSLLELTKSMRQKDDLAFAEILERVRNATCTEDDISILKSRELQSDSEYPLDALHVFAQNSQVDEFNQMRFQSLNEPKYTINAIDNELDTQTRTITLNRSPKASANGGLRHLVSVAVAARVMIIVNIDVADGLSNGVVGSVVAIQLSNNDVQTILIRFDSDRVGRKARANSQYKQVNVYLLS